MKALAGTLLLAAGLAHGAPIVEVTDGDVRVELHADAGPCQHGALWAVFYRGRERTSGCWRLVGADIFIAWLDADASRIPARLFREPKPL